MSSRQLVVLAAGVVLLLSIAAPPAGAAEVEAPRISYEEIVQDSSDAAAPFLPEPYERPGFFDWYVFPLIVLGVLAFALTLFRYLQWQPRFVAEDEEREAKR